MSALEGDGIVWAHNESVKCMYEVWLLKSSKHKPDYQQEIQKWLSTWAKASACLDLNPTSNIYFL